MDDSKPDVLIIDDEPSIAALIELLLNRLGHKVHRCGNGVSGLEYWQAHRDSIRIVILDIVMPRLDGLGVIAALRSQGGKIPVLIISAVPDLDARQSQYRIYSPVDFLAKPFGPLELQSKVNDLLGL
jgi:CheY-like chemotaxis protein